MRVQFSTSMASLQYRGHAISDMRVADLRKELSDRGLDRAGTKNILVVRFAKVWFCSRFLVVSAYVCDTASRRWPRKVPWN